MPFTVISPCRENLDGNVQVKTFADLPCAHSVKNLLHGNVIILKISGTCKFRNTPEGIPLLEDAEELVQFNFNCSHILSFCKAPTTVQQCCVMMQVLILGTHMKL